MGDEELKFPKMLSMHSYPTRVAMSENYSLQRINIAKTQQSVKTFGVKFWNNCPDQ